MPTEAITSPDGEVEGEVQRVESGIEELDVSGDTLKLAQSQLETSLDASDSVVKEAVTDNIPDATRQDDAHVLQSDEAIEAYENNVSRTALLNGAHIPFTNAAGDPILATAQGFSHASLIDATIGMPPGSLDGLSRAHNEVLPILPTLPISQSGDHEFGLEYPSSDGVNKEQTGYFKLEFPDAQLYIDTLRTVFGRDTDATRRKKMGHLPYEGSQHDGHSVISESGGILNLGLKETRRSKKSRGRTSRSSSSIRGSRRNSVAQHDNPFPSHNYRDSYPKFPSARIFAHGTATDVKTDKETTWVKLHAKEGSHGGGISREHAAIIYNFEEAAFELHIYGRNGAFLDDAFFEQGGVVNLQHGCTITISGVSMRWLLPYDGVEGTIGSEAQSAMSFEFEDGRGESIALNDTSESSSSNEEDEDEDVEVSNESGSDDADVISQDDEPQEVLETVESNEEEEQEEEEDDEEPDEEKEQKAAKVVRHHRKLKLKPPKAKKASKSSKKVGKEAKMKKPDAAQASEKPPKAKVKASPQLEPNPMSVDDPILRELLKDIPPEQLRSRRKGPGRPPKNGIMSKREQAVLVRQQKEAQKAEAIKNGTYKPAKPKIGESIEGLPGKRKYTKRKRLDGQPDENGEFQELVEDPEDVLVSALSASKPPKEKRPPKPPRSPSPILDESQLTEEQLAKPTASYVVLIHEALSNSPSGQMSLPQIYKAIERRWPYFKFKVATQGWQSSVRHNLSQHAAFKKIERDGKGWMWGLVPDITIEKEKKRRPTPPPVQSQPYYQPPPQMFRGTPQFPYHGVPVDGRRPPSHMPYMYSPAPGHGYPTGPYPPGIPHQQPGVPLPPGAPQSSSTYQSPYGSAPSASTQQQGQQQHGHQTNYQPYFPPHSGGSGQVHHLGPGQVPNPTRTKPPYQYQTLQNQRPRKSFEEMPIVVEQVARFKEILIPTLDIEDKEEIVDRVIDQALNKVPTSKDLFDPRQVASGIYTALVNLLKPLRVEYDEEQTSQIPSPPAPTNGPQNGRESVPATINSAVSESEQSASPKKAISLTIDRSGSPSDKPQVSQASEALEPRVDMSKPLVEAPENVPSQPSEGSDEMPPAGLTSQPPIENPQETAPDGPTKVLSTSAPALETEERAQILNLLQRLDPSSSKSIQQEKMNPMPASQTDSSEATTGEGPALVESDKPVSAIEVLHASEEAANIVMNAMGLGQKRRHADGEEDGAELSEEPLAKRVAA